MKYIKLFEAYYEDLTEYKYGRRRYGNSVNIGWLEKDKEYAKGEVDEDIVSKIKKAKVIEQYRGFHACPFCGERRGSSTTHIIESKDKNYIFPGLLTHYIKAHGYKPPDEFLEAVKKF